MDAFFIVIAIFLSVVLLFRYAIPMGKPKFAAGERMSDHALAQRFGELGKECSAVRRGFGLYYRKFDIGKKIGLIEKKSKSGIAICDWEKLVVDNKQILHDAFLQSLNTVRVSYTLGHVRGNYPRLFVLCSEIVRCSNGDLTRSRVELALKSFEQFAPLSAEEKKHMPQMLLFCLCGFLSANANVAQIYGRMYDRGIADGKANKIDLDRIKNVFYVSGLIHSSKNAESAISVLENNGVNIADAVDYRKKFLAEIYVVASSVIQAVASIMQNYISDKTESRLKIPPKRMITVLNIMPIVLTLISAVLICIFANARYAALVAISAVIFYGCFRLPVLLYSPQSAFDIIEYIKKRKKTNFARAYEKRVRDSEIAYFGVCPEYAVNMLCGNKLNVTCDNKGKICLLSGQTDEVEIMFEIDGKILRLAEFYGIHARNKSVYRLITSGVDLSAEIIVPTDFACCCLRITALNRDSTEKTIRCTTRVSTKMHGENYTDNKFVAIENKDSVMGISRDGNAVYDINTESRLGIESNIQSAASEFSLNGYCKRSAIFCVAYGTCVAEIERIFDCIKSDGFFDYSRIEAYAYGGECPLNNSDEYEWHDNTDRDIEPEYPAPEIAEAESGEFIVPESDEVVNTLHGGGLSAEFYKSAIGAIYDTASGNRMPCGGNIGILFGENGIIWSPFSLLADLGKRTALFGCGVSIYRCAYNGCKCTVKCCVAVDAEKTMLFDITIENVTANTREIDTVLSVRASDNARIVPGSNKIAAISDDTPFSVFCSREITESAESEEAWFERGRPIKTRSFISGGSTPAAVASVKSIIEPESKCNITFCVSFGNGDHSDKTISSTEKYFKDIHKIDLKSSDKKLNNAYKRALYGAYMGGLMSDTIDCSVLCCCKYADPEAVRFALVRLLSEQRVDGAFIDRNGMAVCYVVVDYILHTGDFGLLYTSVPFLPYYSMGKRNTVFGTVKEHCARYLDSEQYVFREDMYKYAVYSIVENIVYGFFARIYKNDPVRSAYYRQKAEDAAIEHGKISAKLSGNAVTRFKSEYDALIYAAALYCGGRFDEAYTVVSTITDKLLSGKFLSVNKENARTNAVYYLVVTEMLMGMRLYGKRIKINPRISENCPHIEAAISDNGKRVNIVIDESKKNGDWRTKIDRIYYSENNIAFDDRSKTVVLYRDGNG